MNDQRLRRSTKLSLKLNKFYTNKESHAPLQERPSLKSSSGKRNALASQEGNKNFFLKRGKLDVYQSVEMKQISSYYNAQKENLPKQSNITKARDYLEAKKGGFNVDLGSKDGPLLRPKYIGLKYKRPTSTSYAVETRSKTSLDQDRSQNSVSRGQSGREKLVSNYTTTGFFTNKN